MIAGAILADVGKVLEYELGADGKSRIVSELCASVAQQRHRVVHMQCSPYNTNSAFYPVIAYLERAAGFARTDAPSVKLDKLAQAQAQVPAPAAVASQPPSQTMPMMASVAAPEITGSVPPSAPRKVVKGWSVRQAYEGIAILQGPNGVIEAVLGQQVPGLGRIEEIKNENGRLVVESSGGVIYSSRKATP